MNAYNVVITWDDEGNCWSASDPSIGIYIDSGSLDALIEIVKVMVWDITGQKDFFIDFKASKKIEAHFG